MLVVKIELWPGGDGGRVKTLAVGTIINDGTGSETRGFYNCVLGTERKSFWRESFVPNFPRKRYNVWYLLQRCLNEALR